MIFHLSIHNVTALLLLSDFLFTAPVFHHYPYQNNGGNPPISPLPAHPTLQAETPLQPEGKNSLLCEE